MEKLRTNDNWVCVVKDVYGILEESDLINIKELDAKYWYEGFEYDMDGYSIEITTIFKEIKFAKIRINLQF